MISALIDASAARDLFDYDPKTGILRWKRRVNSKVAAGARAGTAHSAGYVSVRIKGRAYLAHRLIWAWMTGEWPENEIDHINHERADNRWTNLRAATVSENRRNTLLRRDSSCGVKGVTYHRRDHIWMAQIGLSGHHEYLGSFSTKEEAARAYAVAAARMHGEFACDGKA